MLFYDLLYFLAIIIALPVLAKFLFNEKYRAILKHRLTPNIPYSQTKRIWIHAVSVGEVRSLKNLLENLNGKTDEEKTGIVLTVTTPTGYEFARQQYKSIPVINAPVDFSFTIKKFIKQINPQLLILNELEMWPNWLTIAKKKNIPVLLVNGRISDLAFKRYKRYKFFLKQFFNKIDRFLVQAEIYRDRFMELGIPTEKIAVCGNIKADEAFNAVEHLPPDTDILKTLGIPKNRLNKKIFTVASSHLTDEQLVFPIINDFARDYLFIIVPRHLTRVEEIEKLLEKHGINYATWSKRNGEKTLDETCEALIFDRMGYLFNVLKISDVVFMGGTLEQKIGGHNLYEPAALGKTIVGGPFYNNFPAIGTELVNKGVYRVADTPGTLADYLDEANGKTGKFDIDGIRRDGINAVSVKRGSIQCILEEIHRSIT